VIFFSQCRPTQVPTKPAAIIASTSGNQSLKTNPAMPNTSALGACCMVITAEKVATVCNLSLKRAFTKAATRGPEAPTKREINPVTKPPPTKPARPRKLCGNLGPQVNQIKNNAMVICKK